tara:strand:- start:41 stop:445 length:405 start_codon:yes stop_codon:yes gene_type:complete
MKRLIELANKLDNLGLTSEADAIDNIIKKSNWWEDERPEPEAQETQEVAGQGETILEGDIPEGEEPSVGGSDVYVVMLVGQGQGGTYTLRGVYSSRDKAESAMENADSYGPYASGTELEMRKMQLDSSEQIEAY